MNVHSLSNSIRNPLGSRDGQPAVVGSLPPTLKPSKTSAGLERSEISFRQAAEKDRLATANPSCGGLAACAPQHVVHMPLHDLSNAASTACCDMTGTGCAGETRVS